MRPRAVQGCSASGGSLRAGARRVRQRENRNKIFLSHPQPIKPKNFVDVCSLLQSFALSRSVKKSCSIFALSIDDNASFGCARCEIASALAFRSLARNLQRRSKTSANNQLLIFNF